MREEPDVRPTARVVAMLLLALILSVALFVLIRARGLDEPGRLRRPDIEASDSVRQAR